MPTSGGLTPLEPRQFDLHNETQAMDFLAQLLDDSALQYIARDFSRYFWYGIAAIIAIFSAKNLLRSGSLILG